MPLLALRLSKVIERVESTTMVSCSSHAVA